jgi:hypothetical protein
MVSNADSVENEVESVVLLCWRTFPSHPLSPQCRLRLQTRTHPHPHLVPPYAIENKLNTYTGRLIVRAGMPTSHVASCTYRHAVLAISHLTFTNMDMQLGATMINMHT